MVFCGHVYHLFVPIAQKNKLLVPAYMALDGRVRMFPINSERTEFQISKPEVRRHLLPLARNLNTRFLTHDSWLACDEVIGGFTTVEIEQTEDCHRGALDTQTIAAVRVLIDGSRLYSDREKEVILSQWPPLQV